MSVDPGKKAGWSVFVDDKYNESGCCGGDLYRDFEEIKKLLNKHNPDQLIIETQYIGKFTNGLITLVERRCVWQVLGMLLGCEITLVYPPSWQSHFGLKTDKKIKSNYKRKKDFKNRILEFAKKKIGKDTMEYDESDATLIGAYFIETQLDQ